jgi:hypothetical protein
VVQKNPDRDRKNNMRRMLETAEERVKLLKAGFSGKTIEKLYIESNYFKIVRTPAIIDLVELDFPKNIETVLILLSEDAMHHAEPVKPTCSTIN